MDTTTPQDILDALRQEVAAVLKVPPSEVSLTQGSSLQERGVASMGALRIQFRLQEKLGVLIPLVDILDARDLRVLAEQLRQQLVQADE